MTEEPESFETKHAMKASATAKYGAAEAKLEQVLKDLKLLIGERESELLDIVQARWRGISRSVRGSHFRSI